MIGNTTVRSSPTAEPLSLAEAKIHLVVDADITDEDGLITTLIAVARSFVEGATNRAMVTRAMRSTFCEWPDRIDLAAPLRKVSAITYLDTSGVSQTLPVADYVADLADSTVRRAYLATWPSLLDHPAAVSVDYISGYATPFTANTTSDALSAAGHPLANGDCVRLFNSGGGLPAPFTAGANYYVVGVTADTLQLALTSGGTAIDITTAGTGTHYVGGPDDSSWVAMIGAMKLMAGHWFDNRSEAGSFPVHEIPRGASALMAQHKVWGI